MERREFVRNACSICLIAGAEIIVGGLSSCSPLEVYDTLIKDHAITVPRSLLEEKKILILRPENLEYDIALEKRSDGSLCALLLRCTHASNPISFDGNGFSCPLHGSRFDEQGKVTRGPASFPLQQLATRIVGDQIIVSI
jgi:Rieske Fe-S protein